jgi:hypothetical protein
LIAALGLTRRQLQELAASVPPPRDRRLRVNDRRDPRTQVLLAYDALAEEGGAG